MKLVMNITNKIIGTQEWNGIFGNHMYKSTQNLSKQNDKSEKNEKFLKLLKNKKRADYGNYSSFGHPNHI